MTKKIFNFLTRTKIGLLILINLFFVAGLFGATGYFIGGLIWFGGNAFFMFFATAADVPTVKPPVEGGGSSSNGGGETDNNTYTDPTAPANKE